MWTQRRRGHLIPADSVRACADRVSEPGATSGPAVLVRVRAGMFRRGRMAASRPSVAVSVAGAARKGQGLRWRGAGQAGARAWCGWRAREAVTRSVPCQAGAGVRLGTSEVCVLRARCTQKLLPVTPVLAGSVNVDTEQARLLDPS